MVGKSHKKAMVRTFWGMDDEDDHRPCFDGTKKEPGIHRPFFFPPKTVYNLPHSVATVLQTFEKGP